MARDSDPASSAASDAGSEPVVVVEVAAPSRPMRNPAVPGSGSIPTKPVCISAPPTCDLTLPKGVRAMAQPPPGLSGAVTDHHVWSGSEMLVVAATPTPYAFWA